MSSIKRKIAEWTLVGLITIISWLSIDLLFGVALTEKFLIPGEVMERRYRIKEPVYHHGLAPNFDGLGRWGPIVHRLCTDTHGFKTDCDKKPGPEKHFDIAFIGDSFTEGVGLIYEETFVGRIARARPDLRISNMGVSSYSPAIYLSKLKKFLADGYTFKELVVFVDVGDIQDDAVFYRYSDGIVTDVDPETSPYQKWLNIAYILFPFTITAYLKASSEKLVPTPAPVRSDFLSHDFPRSGWTVNESVNDFGELGVNGAIARSLELMSELHALTSQHGIALLVGVYPWPGQLLHDQVESRHVKIWRTFCEMRCVQCYDAFPVFFAVAKELGVKAAIDRLYIKGDLHHSTEGAKLIADLFLSKHKQRQ
jgi:hypothetical protein